MYLSEDCPVLASARPAGAVAELTFVTARVAGFHAVHVSTTAVALRPGVGAAHLSLSCEAKVE